jgi:hypothetical protein
MTTTYPWRFNEGDIVYVRGWYKKTATILRRLELSSDFIGCPSIELSVEALNAIKSNQLFPHYEVQDILGSKYILSQLELSSSYISDR